jgi:PadR family transcriptional regulator PadR
MKMLGQLEMMMMLAALHLGKDAYGGRIRDELEERAGKDLALGTVYVTMKRLEKRGLVRSWLGEPTAERGGKAKRFYAVEPAGVEALHAAQEGIGRMWKELPRNAGPA